MVCSCPNSFSIQNHVAAAELTAAHTGHFFGRVPIIRLGRHRLGHSNDGIHAVLSPEKRRSWSELESGGHRCGGDPFPTCSRDDPAGLLLRSPGRRAWWQRTRVRRVPRRGQGRGDGAAAGGLQACVPRRVHRPLARRTPDVPGVPVDRSLIDSP